jgi:hypothetical protein
MWIKTACFNRILQTSPKNNSILISYRLVSDFISGSQKEGNLIEVEAIEANIKWIEREFMPYIIDLILFDILYLINNLTNLTMKLTYQIFL